MPAKLALGRWRGWQLGLLVDQKITMNAMRRNLRIAAIWAAISVVLSLTLAACGTQSAATPAPDVALSFGTPGITSAESTPAAALTEEKNNADNQAVATAAIVRANAQATLTSANATVNAAQTQDQNNANAIAAQIAGTALLVRAHAQATLVAAGSTQSAALTQDAIRQTQAAVVATTGAEAAVNQQNKDALAASTQTAVANNIATQTQVAVATSQWYTDRARQRAEQLQVPIAFLWMWCLPVFIVLFAGLCLWGFWRWLKIRQNRQPIANQPIDSLNLQTPVGSGELQDKFLQPGSDIVNGRDELIGLTQPDDQMRGWLDEVKRRLLDREKDKDDDSNS